MPDFIKHGLEAFSHFTFSAMSDRIPIVQTKELKTSAVQIFPDSNGTFSALPPFLRSVQSPSAAPANSARSQFPALYYPSPCTRETRSDKFLCSDTSATATWISVTAPPTPHHTVMIWAPFPFPKTSFISTLVAPQTSRILCGQKQLTPPLKSLLSGSRSLWMNVSCWSPSIMSWVSDSFLSLDVLPFLLHTMRTLQHTSNKTRLSSATPSCRPKGLRAGACCWKLSESKLNLFP